MAEKMSSRKEEERNEKIIRGLMKLPPNRRCINCNSLGPQYVCTNFWTFVCVTCSGIHREFTHRVKSVSMAKFTSQEVEALQRGGNQRAREIFLREWDLQRQRLPDSSNVDKVREFIKNVYIEKKYAGGKTSDKPPRDMQAIHFLFHLSLRNYEDQTRRASSYHSYSQSPPYEYQYEDRHYGKQVGVLSRKPGSDRVHYEGKISSFVYSPGRYEDRFANEGSAPRVSDCSVSSGGDAFRSDTQSPNFQKDIGFSSPVHPVKDFLSEDGRRQTLCTLSDANLKRDADVIPHSQRSASLGSFGSFDSNSVSLKSVNSGNLFDIFSEAEPSGGTLQDASSVSSVHFFQQPASTSAQPLATSSALSVDLFQLPATSSASSLDLPQPPPTSSAPSIDLFADINFHQSAATLWEQKPQEFSFQEGEGWATFDMPQHLSSAQETKNVTHADVASGDGIPVGKFDDASSVSTGIKWPQFENYAVQGSLSSTSYQWNEGHHDDQVSTAAISTQSWNAFEDNIGSHPQISFGNLPQKSEPQVPAQKPHLTSDQYLSSKISEDLGKDGFLRVGAEDRLPIPSIPHNRYITGSSFSQPVIPLVGGLSSHATDRKSSNPFDLSYDSNLEPSNMFLDMSSLQTALPNPQLPPAFLSGLPEPWFPQNPVTSYIPNTPQGGLASYMAGQVPSSQLPGPPACLFDWGGG
ncbi:PREDICTED: probable ADP-ribosylation factor GTPase-activating protein AGD14 isoform X2 [Nelumbo nucifera]|uniref:Probable ADP-ribosylation factor GTPase-activating protein AGD14 isoform X2 n=1 Tax=Nelumbo nucifera TaxID=4432 RepID=A0A1U7YYT3_NELNU|nr:PREDICTED: probable ADP-ribosylation factor GTPase-activating protein AGD14 isoform X2 [Nelumbo nucifera]